ncbi:hypothetical protein FKW77_000971 [Venturia effusa]|uniref:Haloacid dehalogenase, type II n=1 Tax=Venturia effusa TaxID=50376 RepID=A0A517LNB6_9PEZI|nr:hypothetical protein FKW77_000971 [Venturia effusa]
MSPTASPFPHAKALFFDLMGTLCDWHTSITSLLKTLPPLEQLPQEHHSAFALEWRSGFFEEIHARFLAADENEDIDITHQRVLDRLLEERRIGCGMWDEDVRQGLVKQWHEQVAWPDVLNGLQRLRKNYEVIVLANGTTRLQLDICKSAGLEMDMLFSSQLLGMTKPDTRIYLKAAELVGAHVGKGECLMVAAHAYDLRAAKKAGMGTVYIHRETEDPEEDFDDVRNEVDLFVDGRTGTNGSNVSGLAALAETLGW